MYNIDKFITILLNIINLMKQYCLSFLLTYDNRVLMRLVSYVDTLYNWREMDIIKNCETNKFSIITIVCHGGGIKHEKL